MSKDVITAVIDSLASRSPTARISRSKDTSILKSLFFKTGMRAGHTIFTSLGLLIPVLLAVYLYTTFTNSDTSKMATKPSMFNSNVYKKPLALFSQKPMTGFYRDGYCRTGAEDGGNHAVAAVVTDEFLDFSASRGNDLRKIGLTGGCKWCLCTSRWKEALDARKGDNDPVVPKVFLHATDESALKTVGMEDLKKFAAEGEASNASTEAQTPSGKPGAMVRETH